MPYEPRLVSFLGRTERLKHYETALTADAPRPELAAATRRAAKQAVPTGAYHAAGGAGDAGQLRLGGEAADRRRGLPPSL